MTAPLPILRSRALELDPRTYERGLSCVHCGLCLPACPTYTQSGYEADSPRGRIQLMLGLAEGTIDATASVRHHLDLCLDCRACETACPSGVVYHELIEEARARLAKTAKPTLQDRFMRWIFFHIFTHPTRLKLALLPARLMQKIGLYGLLRKSGIFRLLPKRLRKMEQMLPASGAVWPRRLSAPAATSHHGPPPANRGSAVEIAFFEGCIGSVLFEPVNRQSVELLSAGGASVVVPLRQACCGAIHHHNGAHEAAQELARRNIDAFCPVDGPEPRFIVTNIAGCGAMLREYDLLLRDDSAYARRAMDFAARVRDISEALLAVGLPALPHPVDAVATYHDACHLAHAQKVTSPPRQLLRNVSGLRLIPLPESDICCGAAGTYNLTEPDMAMQLAHRKLANIVSTGANVCITGNVGCAMQIQSEAAAAGIDLRVVHPVQLLHEAAFGRIGGSADKGSDGTPASP
jgi:glycolate oxidase iron-sulfur subunit